MRPAPAPHTLGRGCDGQRSNIAGLAAPMATGPSLSCPVMSDQQLLFDAAPLPPDGPDALTLATFAQQAYLDYDICFRKLAPYVDYFVVNVSSPNTPGLRELQPDRAPPAARVPRDDPRLRPAHQPEPAE